MILDRERIHWVLVGDSTRAKVFSLHLHPLHIAQVASDDIDGLDTVVQDIESDTHGNAQRHRKAVFAHRIADVLNKAVLNGQFQDLILVAPPVALGDIRKMIGPAVEKTIVLEIHGEWTNLGRGELLEHLKSHLASPALA